ncbi:MAG: hypothetical protein ACI8RD_001392 [Bacillariaceae sp.]|jgi:hypothetical protein
MGQFGTTSTQSSTILTKSTVIINMSPQKKYLLFHILFFVNQFMFLRVIFYSIVSCIAFWLEP